MIDRKELQQQMEHVYGEMAPEAIPWNLSEPPELLVEAIEDGDIKPCVAADLGCGAGNYAIWLARQGFGVTGFDFSQNAIKLANRLKDQEKISCRFVVADLLGDIGKYHGKFDFAFDWELLHHISPEDRPAYIQNVYNLLRQNGVYFSVCFSDKDTDFGGEGKFRKTPLGTILYLSSEEELGRLFEPFFKILELKTIEIRGKYNSHFACVAWLEKSEGRGKYE